MKFPDDLKNKLIKNLSETLSFFDYSTSDKENLKKLIEKIGEIPEDIFSKFYNHLLSFEKTKKILERADIKQLKKKQKRYFENILKKDIDENYIKERIKLGTIHYEKGVKLEYYIGSYAKYISILINYLYKHLKEKEIRHTIISLIKVFLLDMYIVINSYSYMEKKKFKNLYKDYKTLFNSINDGVIIIDVDSFKIKEVNKKIEEWLNCKRENLVNREVSTIFLEERKIKTILKEKFEKFPFLYMKNKNGELIPVELSLSFSLKDGKIYAIAIVRNIKYRLETEKKLNISKRLYKVLSAVNHIITNVKSEKSLFEKIVDVLINIGKFESAMIILKEKNNIKPVAFKSRKEIDINTFFKNNLKHIHQCLKKKKTQIFKTEEGEKILIPIKNMNNNSLMEESKIYGILIICSEKISFLEDELELIEEISNDISFALYSLKKHKKTILLEYFDANTKIPNRRYFFKKVEELIKSKKNLSIIIIDINRFKNINETFGFEVGDIILQQFIDRIKSALKNEKYIIARLGGDEFGIIFYDFEKKETVLKKIEKIKSLVKKPFTVNEESIYLSINMGISFYPENGNIKEELIAAAETALKESKKLGSNTFEIYNPLIKKENLEFLILENELRNAILNQEFKLFFQPIFNLKTGKIEGAEALIRWFNPKRGLVPPAKFIHILEEISLIYDVEEFIFNEACKYIRRWQSFNLFVSINISPLQIERGNLLETILKYIHKYDVNPKSLKIELTETVLMENIKKSKEEVLKLNEYGIEMSIDDFGTGYSSLAYLKNIPFYAIKIDRSFIKDIPENIDDMKISKAIINLAHSLDKKVIAEGIEKNNQLEFLKALDCDYGQGYLFSKPVPPEEFEKILEVYI